MTAHRSAPWIALALVLAACAGPTAEPSPTASFVDRTEALGLGYVHSTLSPDGPCLTGDAQCEPEYFAGGAAVGDVDGDGRTDLFVTRLGAHDLLFLNRGERFEEASAAWGLDAIVADTNGAALFDADLDGDLDLVVTALGRPGAEAPRDRYFFFENRAGRFVEDAVARGLAFADGGGHGGTSVAVGDYDSDGWPDLFFTEWRAIDEGNLASPTHERLLHNRGEAGPGHFEDVTIEAGVFLESDGCRDGTGPCRPRSFAATFTDLDGDSIIDLAVAADFGHSRLFFGRGDGTFEEGTEAAGVGTDENGMGSAFGDYDGDGDLDWFVTSIADEVGRCEREGCGWGASGNRLYRNEGARRFVDVTDVAGVRDGGWGWGAAWLDYDHDGDLDLVMTNGFDLPHLDADARYVRDPMRLWRNEGGGAMPEVAHAEGLEDEGRGKGLCVLDVEGDGDLDLFVVNHGEGGRLFLNQRGTERGALRVRVRSARGGAAYGARVRLRVRPGGPWQLREIGTGEHFLCAPEPVAHFGLGPEPGPVAELEVTWPSGATLRLEDLEPDRTLELVEP